ncbi:hypothetical protein ACVXG7_32060 [Enterobacter hormaechei]
MDSSAAAESWDLHATMLGGFPIAKLPSYAIFGKCFRNCTVLCLRQNITAYSELAIAKQDVNASISGHPQVLEFISAYNMAFNGFDDHLNAS